MDELFVLSGVFWVIYLGVILLLLVSMWMVFTKAGKPGWGAIIPIYNYVLLCHIGGKSGWLVLLEVRDGRLSGVEHLGKPPLAQASSLSK